MKAVFASALVAAATALPWEDSQSSAIPGMWSEPSIDYGVRGVSYDVSIPRNSQTNGNPTSWPISGVDYRCYNWGLGRGFCKVRGPSGWIYTKWGENGDNYSEAANSSQLEEFCKYWSVYRPAGEGSSALEQNALGNQNGQAWVTGPNDNQWEADDSQSATKSTFCKACFGGDDVQTTTKFCKACFGGDVEVQTKFCKACFGGDDAETTARFCKSCFGGDDAQVKARFCKSCFGGDVESTARFCKACFGGDDAEVKARFCKSCFGGDDAETTARFCKSCFGGDDAEVKARFCKACFGGDDVATTVAFCKSCFGGDDAEVKARFCKSCFGGDVETHARFCKSCFGGDDAEVHSRFCKSCFGGDVEARVKCDCSNKESANHYGLYSKWALLKELMAKAYSILAAAHELGVDPDACECALGTDSTTKHYLPGGGLAYDKYMTITHANAISVSSFPVIHF